MNEIVITLIIIGIGLIIGWINTREKKYRHPKPSPIKHYTEKRDKIIEQQIETDKYRAGKTEESEEDDYEYSGALTLSTVPSLVVMLVVIAIVLGVSASILESIQSEMVIESIHTNITNNSVYLFESYSEWLSIWPVIIAAAVVIGIVGRYFFFRL